MFYRKIYLRVSPLYKEYIKVNVLDDKSYKSLLKKKNINAGPGCFFPEKIGGKVISNVYLNKDEVSISNFQHELIHCAFLFLAYKGVGSVGLIPYWGDGANPHLIEENFCSVWEFLNSRANKIFSLLQENTSKNDTKDYFGAKNFYKFPF